MPKVQWTGDARAHSAPATDDWDPGEIREMSDEEAKDFTETNPWYTLVPDDAPAEQGQDIPMTVEHTDTVPAEGTSLGGVLPPSPDAVPLPEPAQHEEVTNT